MTESSSTPAHVLLGMKEKVLRFSMGLLVVTVLPQALAVLLAFLVEGRGSASFWCVYAFMIAGPIVLLGIRAWQVEDRARVHLAYLLTIPAAGTAYYGFTMDIPPIQACALVLAVIYFGRAGFRWVLALSVLSLSAVLVAFAIGVVHDLGPRVRDPSRIVNAARINVSLFFSTLAVCALVGYLVRGLVDAIAEASEAMAREEAARDAREEAEVALQQTQRLETVGRVAGGVAHDFNNALVVILGTAQLLQRKAASTPKEKRLVDIIVKAAWSASEVSKQLLAFSRSEPSSPRDVVLSEWLPSIMAVLRRLLPEDIAIEGRFGTDATIHIDPGQLEQVLYNLAINAHDAMPEGGQLEIRTHDADAPPGVEATTARWVAIEIVDTGRGMEPEVLERVFEPFFTTKSVDHGTGLGIPVVHGIIASAGGHVEIHSAPDEGTAVRLVVPAVDAIGPVASASSEAAAPAASLRVLLAEDREDVRTLMVTVLRQGGHQVEEAVDGTHACEVLEAAGPFDVLCTDAIMPGTSVDELIDRFRAACPSAAVMICSAHVEDEAVRRRVARGDVAFLAKPFAPSELLDKVEAIAAGRAE